MFFGNGRDESPQNPEIHEKKEEESNHIEQKAEFIPVFYVN